MFRCPTLKTFNELREVSISDFASERLIQNVAKFEKLNFIDVKINPITLTRIKYVLAQVMLAHN